MVVLVIVVTLMHLVVAAFKYANKWNMIHYANFKKENNYFWVFIMKLIWNCLENFNLKTWNFHRPISWKMNHTQLYVFKPFNLGLHSKFNHTKNMYEWMKCTSLNIHIVIDQVLKINTMNIYYYLY